MAPTPHPYHHKKGSDISTYECGEVVLVEHAPREFYVPVFPRDRYCRLPAGHDGVHDARPADSKEGGQK